MKLQKPDQRVLAVWRIRLAVLTVLPAFLSACFFPSFGWVWGICTGAWVLAFFYFYIFYYPIKYKKLFYSCNRSSLLLHCGVIYTRVKAVPFASIQYTLLVSTPLERLLGVCTLMVFCAGSVAWQPGLTPAAARALRDNLEARGGAADG